MLEPKPFTRQGGVHDRAGGHARARARRCASRASASATSPRSSSSTATRSSRCDIDRKYRDLVHTRRDGAAAPEDRPEGHVRRARPGHDGARRWPRRASRSRSPRRCPTSTPTRSSSALDADTRDYLRLLLNGAGDGPARPRRRPARGAAPLRADLPRPRARSPARSQARRVELRRLIHVARRAQRRARGARTTTSPQLVAARRASFRALASERRATSPATVARAARRRCAGDARRSTRSSGVAERARADDERAAPGRARAATTANAARPPFAREAAPIVRDADPPVRARGAAARARPRARRRTTSSAASPELHARVHRPQPPLQHARPTTRTAARRRASAGRDEGYLFWLGWLGHQAQHSSAAPTRTGPCARSCSAARATTLRGDGRRSSPSSSTLLGLTGALTDPRRLRQRRAAADAEAGAHLRPHARDGRSSRCRASGCCCSCGCPSAAPCRCKPKGYRFEVGFPEATQLGDAGRRAHRRRKVGKVAGASALAARQPHAARRSSSTAATRRSHADARAILRQKTLLGETYVELTPGSERRAVHPGGRAAGQRAASSRPSSSTRSSTPSTRRRARRSGRGSSSLGQGDRRARRRTSTTRSATCRASSTTAPTLLAGARPTSAARCGRSCENTGVGLRRADRARGPAARPGRQHATTSSARSQREREALRRRRGTIFPTFLDESRATFRAAGDVRARTRAPLVRDLRPALRDLAPTLRVVRRPVARPAAAVPQPRPADRPLAQRRCPRCARSFDGLRPMLGTLGPFLRELNPILDWLGQHQHTVTDIFANLGVADRGAHDVERPARRPATTCASTGRAAPRRSPSTRRGCAPTAATPTSTRSSTRRRSARPFKSGILASGDCRNAGGEKPVDRRRDRRPAAAASRSPSGSRAA